MPVSGDVRLLRGQWIIDDIGIIAIGDIETAYEQMPGKDLKYRLIIPNVTHTG